MEPFITIAIPDLAGPTALLTTRSALTRHTLEPHELMLFVEAGSRQTVGSRNSLDISTGKETPGSNFPSKQIERRVHTTIDSQPEPADISTSNLPLVSCIMPTRNRRDFVRQTLIYFDRQSYPNRELIIVEDGNDRVSDLIPLGSHVNYITLSQKTSIGAKRNIACEQAHGTIIAHWDDDDWQAPHRLSYQVEALLREGTDICGIKTLLFYDIRTGHAWQYVYPDTQREWLSGSTLCYERSLWASNRFADINVGEDSRFVWSNHRGRVTILPDVSFHVGIIHQYNVSPKPTTCGYWHSYSVEAIRGLLGADWAFYQPHHTEIPVGRNLSIYPSQKAKGV